LEVLKWKWVNVVDVGVTAQKSTWKKIMVYVQNVKRKMCVVDAKGKFKEEKVATTVAKYKFDDGSSYKSALERIQNEVGSYSYNGYDYDSSNYIISMDDTCQKGSLIGQICRALGGTPYN
jgi:hypothetical protein